MQQVSKSGVLGAVKLPSHVPSPLPSSASCSDSVCFPALRDLLHANAPISLTVPLLVAKPLHRGRRGEGVIVCDRAVALQLPSRLIAIQPDLWLPGLLIDFDNTDGAEVGSDICRRSGSPPVARPSSPAHARPCVTDPQNCPGPWPQGQQGPRPAATPDSFVFGGSPLT